MDTNSCLHLFWLSARKTVSFSYIFSIKYILVEFAVQHYWGKNLILKFITQSNCPAFYKTETRSWNLLYDFQNQCI